MSGLRPPVFAGVARGVGTTTLARALHGVDGGLAPGGRPAGGVAADVLVCRADSLSQLTDAGSPVLAVVADRPPRLDRIPGRFGTIVTVPDIAAWHGLHDPEVAGLLAVAPGRRSARTQAYVDALLAITAAVLRSGVLARPGTAGQGPTGPAHHRAAPAVRVTPGGRAVPARPVPVPALPTSALPTSALPSPVVPAPVLAAPAVPAPVRATGRPLWRGLRAVERVPVRVAPSTPVPLRRSAATAPVPGPRPGPPLLDDDALESMRAG